MFVPMIDRRSDRRRTFPLAVAMTRGGDRSTLFAMHCGR